MKFHPFDKQLPPIRAYETRAELLAWSYEDAALGSNDGGRGSKPGSRGLSRNPLLWNYGSYDEFEKNVDKLNGCRREFWACYVNGGPRTPDARRGLTQMGALLKAGGFVHVPVAVSLAAGYALADAKVIARLRDPELE